MKKKLIRTTSLLLVACLLFLSGCQNPGDAPAKTPEEFWAQPHEWSPAEQMFNGSTEYGYYYLDASFLTYFDYTAKKSVVLCNKAGCKHEDTSCEAYYRSSLLMFSREDKIYLVTNSVENVQIFECNLDATNRVSKIILMQDEMEKGNAVGVGSVCVSGDDLYYSANYLEPADASGAKKDPIKAIRHVNLKTWQEEEICRSVENEYSITATDAGGVLIFERPDLFVVADIDFSEDAEWRNSENPILFTTEMRKSWLVAVLYWDKKTKDLLKVYQDNYYNKSHAVLANGDFLYMMCTPPEGPSSSLALEKLNMRTGESEILWNEEAGSGSFISGCWVNNNHIYLSAHKPDGVWPLEVHAIEDFKDITPPFLGENDNIMFEDRNGFIAAKVIEFRPNSEQSDVADVIFVPAEEAEKENPEYTVLMSFGRDE